MAEDELDGLDLLDFEVFEEELSAWDRMGESYERDIAQMGMCCMFRILFVC